MDIDFVEDNVILSDGLLKRLMDLIDNSVIGFLVEKEETERN